jgi:hypothetical protein
MLFPLEHKTRDELQEKIPLILSAAKHQGKIELIVVRPDTNQRQIKQEAELDLHLGMIGDNWKDRGNRKCFNGAANPDMQITVMSSRVLDAIAATKNDWPLVGDQLIVDMDLSKENLPPCTQLQIGSAVIEVTAEPHLGCKKFQDRFGKAALEFVNSDFGKLHRFRGLNARIKIAGVVKQGDMIVKIQVSHG